MLEFSQDTCPRAKLQARGILRQIACVQLDL